MGIPDRSPGSSRRAEVPGGALHRTEILHRVSPGTLLATSSTRGPIRCPDTTRVLETRLAPVSHRHRALPPWHVQVLFQTGNTSGLAPATLLIVLARPAPCRALPCRSSSWCRMFACHMGGAYQGPWRPLTPEGAEGPWMPPSPASRFQLRSAPCPLRWVANHGVLGSTESASAALRPKVDCGVHGLGSKRTSGWSSLGALRVTLARVGLFRSPSRDALADASANRDARLENPALSDRAPGLTRR